MDDHIFKINMFHNGTIWTAYRHFVAVDFDDLKDLIMVSCMGSAPQPYGASGLEVPLLPLGKFLCAYANDSPVPLAYPLTVSGTPRRGLERRGGPCTSWTHTS